MPARNLGENQTRTPKPMGATNFGNYDTDHATKRVIKTTVNLGSRGRDGFYKRRTMQDFIDTPNNNYVKRSPTYGK